VAHFSTLGIIAPHMPSTQPTVIKLKTAYEFAFSPNSRRVAFIGGKDVTVLDLKTRKPLFAVHPIANPSDIDFSPDGRRIAVKNTRGRIIILDSKTGRLLCDFRNQKEGEGAAALFSSCGRYVVTVSWDGLLSVRDSVTAEIVFSHIYDGGMLRKLSAPYDRRFFVYSIGYYSTSVGQPPPPNKVVLHPWPIRDVGGRELPQSWPFISGLQVSPSGRLLAVIYGASSETMEIYDIDRSRIVARRAVHFGGTGCSIGWSPDERLLAINGDHRCFVLETSTLEVRHQFTLRYPCYVGFSPSSQFLAVGSWSTSVIVPFDYLATFAESRRGDA
jgi:WD40 repeat protein